MKEFFRKYSDQLYISHIVVIWIGSIAQIIHIFGNRGAQDISLLWVGALVYAHLVAIPRSWYSPYKVWKVCRIGGAILCGLILAGVVLYG